VEQVRERLATARRALSTLAELVGGSLTSPIVRDAAIQRFEYTFEAVWKAAQAHLQEVEGLIIGSPKGVVRLARQVGLLGEEDARLALAMVDDRNLTVHAYNEAIAEAISQRLAGYASLIHRWIEAMAEHLDSA
jgi:nucleotidyltransferase substrate binding protein (TIGR01987 family)